MSWSAITSPRGTTGRRKDSGSKSAAKGTIAMAAPMRGSVCRCGVSSEKRRRMTSLAAQVLIASSPSPRRKVMKPTQDEKSCSMFCRQ